ncbi:50S ribosomal protein L16 [archaeon]|jgi:large subunit ribosomal protein L10e|nr:50S ribosomal protein L16 [archaeon]MBT4241417.1 50S ribosomal protein L16 [archaeon]MBT4417712.1 50S ribosomal protein L16 [archaeon]
MVAKRKASAYSKRKPITNTRRSKKQHLSYIKTIPPQKIVKFNMGDYKGFEAGKYKIKVILSTAENIQIRDFALEAIRQSIHKDMTKLLTQKAYFFRCNVYPHNILRNNRIFSGGSKGERVQTGMKKSFGSPEGRAATLKRGKPIFTLYFNGEEHLPIVKKFFKKVTPKLACKAKVNVEFLK